jgi:hypothetical protein
MISEPIVSTRVGGANANHLLPATPMVGDTVEIVGQGAAGCKITQPTGHTIRTGAGVTVGTNATTTGITGVLTFSTRYSAVKLMCVYADTVTPAYDWVIVSSSGTLTFT